MPGCVCVYMSGMLAPALTSTDQTQGSSRAAFLAPCKALGLDPDTASCAPISSYQTHTTGLINISIYGSGILYAGATLKYKKNIQEVEAKVSCTPCNIRTFSREVSSFVTIAVANAVNFWFIWRSWPPGS